MFVFFIIFIIHYFIFLYSSTLSCDEGEYIAIPGTAVRSVQHLITRVWSAGGHSSSSYKHIIQCILYVVTYSYISGITTIPKQSECNVNSYNKDTIAICTCECPDLMKQLIFHGYGIFICTKCWLLAGYLFENIVLQVVAD